MNTKRNLLFVIIGMTWLCSWDDGATKQIKKAEWLIGTWENKTRRGSIYETWVRISADEFFGKSYYFKDKDTIALETIRLIQEGDLLFYIPAVKNQNKDLPVRFSLKTITETEFAFENQAHVFPQVISYSRIGTDSLVAAIWGIKNGQERKISFPMKKRNEKDF